jgi:hypothetical protein
VLNAQLAIQTLPVSFFVKDTAAPTFRFDGARDWGSKSFRKRWLASD